MSSHHFVECHKAFQQPEELPEAFAIVRRIALPLIGFETVGVRFSSDYTRSIRAALQEIKPFYWDARRRDGMRSAEELFLFGQILWAREPADAGYTPAELTLRFSNAAIRDRKRLERLAGRQCALASDAKRNRRPSISTKDAAFIRQRDGGRCVECGSDTDLQIDHIIPVALKGSSSRGNLRLLCQLCNQQKGSQI